MKNPYSPPVQEAGPTVPIHPERIKRKKPRTWFGWLEVGMLRNSLFWLKAGIVSLPAFAFGWCLYRYAVDIPYIDDFHLYNFLLHARSSDSWTDRIGAFFEQTNEHRVAVARLSTWLTYQLTGRFDLRYLMAEGFGFLVLVLVVLGRVFQTYRLPWHWFLPVPGLLFMMQGWSNYFWGFCAASNVAVLGWVALGVYLLSRYRHVTGLVLAVGCAGLATFSTGSGLMVVPAGAAVLALARRWRHLTLWMLIGGLYALMYFYDFKLTPKDSWTDTLLQSVPNWFTYSGSFIELWGNPPSRFVPVCFGVGLLMAGLGIWRLVAAWAPYRQGRHQPALLLLTGLVVYLSLTAGLVALNRSSMVEDRYKINSALLALCVYLLWVPVLARSRGRRWWAGGLIGAALSLCVYSYVRYLPDVINFRQELLGNLYSILETKTGVAEPYFRRITTLQTAGIYQIPAAYEREFAPLLTNQLRVTATKQEDCQTRYAALRIELSPELIRLRDSTMTWTNQPDEGLYVVLIAEHGQVAVRMRRESASLGYFLTTGRHFTPGGRLFLAHSLFNAGTYRLCVYGRREGTDCLEDTGLTVVNRSAPRENWLR